MTDNKDTCTDCPKPVSRRDFTKNAAKFGFIPAAALFFGVGGKDIIRNAVTSDERVPMTDEQLQAWIKTPGLVDAFADYDLSPERRAAITEEITSGNWQYFRGQVLTEQKKEGQADAACSHYWTILCVSCCTAHEWYCYQCNGETLSCVDYGIFSRNCCSWCGHGPTCCG